MSDDLGVKRDNVCTFVIAICANVRSLLILLPIQFDALFLASMKRIAARTGGKESTSPVKLTRQLIHLLLMRRTNVSVWSPVMTSDDSAAS